MAASQSANIIRIGSASPVAIAAWRLLLAALLLLPLALRAGGLRGLSRRELGFVALAGVTLALHFFTWIAGVQGTSVANAALLLAISPVLTAVGGWFFLGERPTVRLVVALGLGVAGVAVIGGSDLQLTPHQLPGDGLAIVSAVLFSVYALLGRRMRGHIPNATYVTTVYGVAALVGFIVLLSFQLPVVDYSSRDWLCFVLMALIPTGIGHTALNHALRYLSAATVSVLILTEPPVAGLVAWWAWGEPIREGMVAGYVLIAAAVVVLVSGRGAAVLVTPRDSPDNS